MAVTEQQLRKDYPEGTRIRITRAAKQLRDPDMPGPMLCIDDEGTVTGVKDDYLIVEWDLGISRWIQLNTQDAIFSLGWAVDIISRPLSFTACVHELEPLADTLLSPRS